jgi:hypothetical protein
MLFVIPFADDLQYLIKAGWKPAVRIAGFQPAFWDWLHLLHKML